MKILVVEDEKKIAELIENRLKKEDYMVDLAFDGEDGYFKAESGVYDLIIMDIMMPYKDGLTLLKELREKNLNMPVILLTAKDKLEDKLVGFNNGADDYVTKPFHMEELVARVNIKLKKTNKSEENDILSYGDITLDLKRKILKNNTTGEEVEVLLKEFLLLECLIKNNKQVLTKEYIYDYVWGFDTESNSNNLEAYLSFIRKKLKAISSNITIKSFRGMGYKLEDTSE